MLIRLLNICVLVYLGFGLYLFFAQRHLMYFPTPPVPGGSAEVEILPSENEQLKIWIVSPGRDRALLYFGGNAEDVYYNADSFRKTLPGHSVYLVNYRGYGGSSGTATEQNLFADALNIHDEIISRHSGVSVIGRSLGSAVAAYLASQRPVEKLVLVTPFDSAVAVGQGLFPLYPVSLLLRDRYESIKYVVQIMADTLIISAEKDRVIPARHTASLAGAFPPAQLEQVVIKNAGHNNLANTATYWEAISRFLSNPGISQPGHNR